MIAAAFRYFGIIFALGFLLGAIRTTLLAPAIGATAAVLVELPVMLATSWIVASRLVSGRRRIPPGRALGVGALAFVLLMIAEALLAATLSDQSLVQWAQDLVRTPGWIGLGAQILFGLMPWLASTFRAPPRR